MASIILGTMLLVAGGGMAARYWMLKQRAQPPADGDSLTAEQSFLARQIRRRLRASLLLAVLGVFLLAGPLVTGAWLQIVYWSGALLVVAWLTILALADMLRTREHFGRLHTDYQVKRAALEAEVARIRAGDSNGAHGHEGNGNSASKRSSR